MTNMNIDEGVQLAMKYIKKRDGLAKMNDALRYLLQQHEPHALEYGDRIAAINLEMGMMDKLGELDED
ncbi:MAG: hypothetical protein AAFU54_30865 [Chloroflexota bacterium]